MKAHRPKKTTLTTLQDSIMEILSETFPDNAEYGQLLRLILNSARTGTYDQTEADKLNKLQRSWFNQLWPYCQRIGSKKQNNQENKGACFDKKNENKRACFDDETGHCPHVYAGGQTDKIKNIKYKMSGQDNDSAFAHKDRDSQQQKTIFPYPEPPNAAETIYRAAINSDFHISAEETIRFYSTLAAVGWRDKYGKPVRDWRRLLKSWQGRQSRENRTSGEKLYQEYSRFGGFEVPAAIQNLDRMFDQTATERDQTADPNQIPNRERIAARGHNPGDCSDPDGDTWTDPDGDTSGDQETVTDPDGNGVSDDEPDPDGDQYPDSG